MSIEKTIRTLEKLERELPIILSEQAKNFFQDSFANQGFTDKTLIKWKPSRAAQARGGATLVKNGFLRNSIKVTKLTPMGFSVGSDMPYARQHNQGEKGQVKRQFIGKSIRLEKLMQARINREIRKAME